MLQAAIVCVQPATTYPVSRVPNGRKSALLDGLMRIKYHLSTIYVFEIRSFEWGS